MGYDTTAARGQHLLFAFYVDFLVDQSKSLTALDCPGIKRCMCARIGGRAQRPRWVEVMSAEDAVCGGLQGS